MNAHCPSCGEVCIRPIGSKTSDLLIVGEFPGDKEMELGRPFVGGAGKVLRSELSKVGLDLLQFRVTNLWLHPITKDENCYKAGYDLVLDEAKEKKAILLVGSEVANAFIGKSVADICGLVLDKHDHPFSTELVMACVNPAIVFHSGIGELRLAIQKFSYELEARNLV